MELHVARRRKNKQRRMRAEVALLSVASAAFVCIFLFLDYQEIQHLLSSSLQSHLPGQNEIKRFTVSVAGDDARQQQVQVSSGARLFLNCTARGGANAEKQKEKEGEKDARLRILLGILTKADLYDRRHFLRMLYAIQRPGDGIRIDVKFVFCRLTKDDQRILVALEILRFNDIIILDCKENMNEGKTYAYLSSLPRMLREHNLPRYDYVLKADDDIFFRMRRLATALDGIPRVDSYFGFVIPCSSDDPFHGHYMAGMGYALSWDLVEWISESEIARNQSVGTEDKLVGQWLDKAGKGKNRFNTKWAMHDFPDDVPVCSRPMTPATIGVHKLKNRERWFRVIRYFNLTASANLTPSRLFRLDR